MGADVGQKSGKRIEKNEKRRTQNDLATDNFAILNVVAHINNLYVCLRHRHTRTHTDAYARI